MAIYKQKQALVGGGEGESVSIFATVLSKMIGFQPKIMRHAKKHECTGGGGKSRQ